MVVAEFKNDNYTSVYGLKQWDFGQELLIKGTGIQGKTVEVHFALERDDVALRMLGTVENGNITVLIPDTLLQVGNSIYAYVYQSGERAGKTTHKIFMHVSPRAKPEDYTEKEFKNALQQVLTIAQSVREDADAGKFNATDEQIRKVVETYMSNHPIEKIETDKTLSIEGQAADAKATGNKILQYAIKNTASGESPLNINDSAEEQFQDIKLLGKSEQFTTTGKNLWNDKSFVRGHINETGEIVEDDSETEINGIWKIEAPQDGAYRIRCEKDSINGIYIKALLSGTEFSKPFLRLSKNVTLPITLKKGINYISGCGYADGNSETFRITGNEKIMISLGQSDPPPYEPYTGGQPSPNPEYQQEIKNSGKYNEGTGKYEVDVVVSNGGYLQKGSYANKVRTFPLEKGKTYRIYVGVNSKVVNAFILNEERTFINSSDLYVYCNTNGLRDENSTGVISGECKIPSLLINGYTFYVTVDGLFLYQGINNSALNTDNAYITYDIIKKVNLDEPYKEQTVKLSLDQPLRGIGEHKDVITKDGIMRRIKQIVWNGRENWSLSTTVLVNTNKFYLPKVDDAYSAYRSISSLVDALPFVGNENSDELGQRFYLGTPMINLDKQKFPDVETLKNWLSENPVTVEYALAEPIIEPLPEEFEQFLKLNSYYPTTVISTDGGEVDPDVEVTYVADTKNYIDNKVSTNVANIISQYQTNTSNLLSLMPLETQAIMIENDTNNILENMEEIKHE